MPTGHVLHPIAQARLNGLQMALEKDFGLEASHRSIISALVYSVTPEVLAGMQIAFVRDRRKWDEAHGESVSGSQEH